VDARNKEEERDDMAPHQQRVVDELKELSDRREKLYAFIGTNPLFGRLPSDEQGRLETQLNIMTQYESVLQERIDHFPG
jgi:uncharacterized protein